MTADAKQALAFANPMRVRVLMACASEEQSLTALQRRLKVPLQRLHYHVGRLLAVKLLAVSRLQHRAGRAIKFYRAVGDSFVVPSHSLSEMPGDAMTAQLRKSLREEESRASEHALLYAAGPGGKVLVKRVPAEPTASARSLELWRIMRLSAHQRQSLARELCAVLERYSAAKPELGADVFLAHAAFAPKPPRG